MATIMLSMKGLDMTIFSERLKSLREERKLTQARLAELSGVRRELQSLNVVISCLR